MRRLRRAKRQLIAFAICLTTTAIIIMASICTTLSQGSFVKNMGSANYYQNAKNQIIEQFNNIAIPSGLPQDFFDDLNLEIDVYEDVNEQIKSVFTGSEIVLNKVKLGNTITENIKKYVTSQGQQIDFATEIEIKSIVDDCLKEYEKQILVPHLAQIVSAWGRIEKYVNTIIIVLFLAVVAACVMIVLSKKWKGHKVSYMAYSFLGSGVSCIIISTATQFIGLYQKINISPTHVKNFVVALINDAVTNIATFGAVAFLAGIVLATLSLSFGKKEIKYRRSKK